jgi:ubiquinone/menaquinone biosynthesis C-methylase UbiE
MQIINVNSMQLPLEDASVDAYLSSFGGCCVADFSAMLKETLRVLKPGGRAAFSLRNEVS